MIQGNYQFGPAWTAEGVVFRLWAPAARQVELLTGTSDVVAMQGDEQGWWRSAPIRLPVGTPYRFRIDGTHTVPDPASRQQEDDVHGASILVAPTSHGPSSGPSPGPSPGPPGSAAPPWRGRPWEESVIYEVHPGTATAEGTFAGLAEELQEIAAAGFTVVELMPIADFPGRWNWGYDGVLPFAPDQQYGTPAELRELINRAHQAGLAIWLDVVYNHFGPEGNYLHLYAPQFFNPELNTPWGAAIDFTRAPVRRFFLENAWYWIHEVGFDGLRLDAVHAIQDPSAEHILSELNRVVRSGLPADRHVHLVLENDRNEARWLDNYDGQWNDDLHHVLHVLLTGEDTGYYRSYSDDPEGGLARALATGYVYQGEKTPEGHRRGEPSGHLPPYRFISFLQNHDQTGNRARGDRILSLAPPEAVRAAAAVQLLCPQIPLVFMGEWWGAVNPFQFFCDFEPGLAEAVVRGRQREFGLADIPHPGDPQTVERSRPGQPGAADWREYYRTLLRIRREQLLPILPDVTAGTAAGGGDEALAVTWPPGWTMWLNLTPRERPLPALSTPGKPVFQTHPRIDPIPEVAPAWGVTVFRSAYP